MTTYTIDSDKLAEVTRIINEDTDPAATEELIEAEICGAWNEGADHQAWINEASAEEIADWLASFYGAARDAEETGTEYDLEKLDKGFGTVEYHGDTLYLLNHAVADNYGTHGAVRYYAKAINVDGTEYRIGWDTTDDWDLASELDRLMAESSPNDDQIARIEELSDMVLPDVSDESNACDWDWPVSVEVA